MNYKKNLTLCFFISVISYALSINLLDKYIAGDQAYYYSFYEAIEFAEISELKFYANKYISSNEPLTWLILWIGSANGLDKNHWISVLNVILIIGIFILLRKNNAPWYIYFLIATNFYLIVLLTAAERLKIAYILLVYAFIFEGRFRATLLFMMPLAHLQSVIILSSIFSIWFGRNIRWVLNNHVIKIKFIYQLIIISITALIIFIFLKDFLLIKLLAYGEGVRISDFINITILFTMTIIILSNKIDVFAAFIPVLIATALVGDQRVNMIAVTIVVGLMMYEKKFNHPIFIALLMYFSYKSVEFISNIFMHGDGFFQPNILN